MKSKARKLAWELLGVLSRYSERDIDDALKLLSTGSVLKPSAELTQLIAASPRRTNPQRSTRLSGGKTTRQISDAEIDRAYRIIDNYDLRDREALKDFASGIATGRYLKGTRLLRDFALNLDIELPKKLPSRPSMALVLVTKLIRLEESQRAELIEAGRRIDENSSLKAWSDLIVKR